MATVSIVIPVHNPGPYLREALASVHRQTYRDWDVTVVDDASSEELSWVLDEFPDVRLIHQPHGGASIARNRGVLESTGELVAFMDQDDLWLPWKLERQVAALLGHPAAGLCFSDVRIFRDGEIDDLVEGMDDPARASAVLLLAGGSGWSGLAESVRCFGSRFVVPSSILYRRIALASAGLLDPLTPFSGDFDMLMKVGARHPVLHIGASDVLYRKHDSNFSDRYEVGRAETAALVERYTALARSLGDTALEQAVAESLRRPRGLFAAQAFDCARRARRSGDRRAAARHLRNALALNPAFVVNSIVVHQLLPLLRKSPRQRTGR